MRTMGETWGASEDRPVTHRRLSAIDAERAIVEARLADLMAEREDARKAEITAMCRLFDAGLSLKQIARQVGQTKAAVQGVLFRSGRTESGRSAIRHQIEKAVALAPQVAAAQATDATPAAPVADLSVCCTTHARHVVGGQVGTQSERERAFPVTA